MAKTPRDTEHCIGFGGIAFDTDSHELHRGKERIVLRPQSGKLLTLLLSKPGRILTQQEIAADIWPDTVVDFEQRIRSTVRDLRSILGDEPEKPRYIETVPRRGYRFIAPLTAKSRLTGPVLWMIAAAIGVIGVAAALLQLVLPILGGASSDGGTATPILAILPVKDSSPPSAESFPVDGLTHQLIARVAQVSPERLAVIGRTSVMKFKDSPLSTTEISQDLGADYLLDSSLDRAGDKLRIITTLVEAISRRVVWSSSYDGTTGDLPSIELQIALAIGQVLQLQPDEDPSLANLRDETRPESYDAYLSGLYILEQRTAETRARSYAFFREAISFDPKFAPAYLGVARSTDSGEEAREAIETALRLDDTLAEAYYLRARRRFTRDWNWEGAASDFATAIALAPGRVEFREWHAIFLGAIGDFPRAMAEAERALILDPLSELASRDLGGLYVVAGIPEKAVETCKRGLRVGLENPIYDHHCLVFAYLEMGDLAAAAEHIREIFEIAGAEEVLDPDTSPQEQVMSFWRWKLKNLETGPEESTDYFGRAGLYASLGRIDEAIEALEEALRNRDFEMIFMKVDFPLSPLHGDPRFQRIVQAVGFPEINR